MARMLFLFSECARLTNVPCTHIANKTRTCYSPPVDEGRKRTLLIAASILAGMQAGELGWATSPGAGVRQRGCHRNRRSDHGEDRQQVARQGARPRRLLV
jgi:hypothetical protein